MTSAVEPRSTDNVKLPLWETIRLSYASYFSNFPDVLRISWLWLVVVVPLQSIAMWVLFLRIGEVVANARLGGQFQRPTLFAGTALGYLLGFIFTLAGISIAVAWHRCIILGEQPRWSGSNLASKTLWRYVGMGLLLVLIAVLVALIPAALILFPISLVWRSAVLILPLLLFYLVGIAVFLRLIPLLPARAIGNQSLTFKQTWNGTRGNTWRLFWGFVLCALPPGLLMQIAFLIFVRSPHTSTFDDPAFALRMTVLYTIAIVYYLLVTPISVGFLSLSYRHFFERA